MKCFNRNCPFLAGEHECQKYFENVCIYRIESIEYNICEECGGSGRVYHYTEDDTGFPCGWCNGKGHQQVSARQLSTKLKENKPMKVKQESPSYVSIKEGGDTIIMTNQEAFMLIADLINLVIKQGESANASRANA